MSDFQVSYEDFAKIDDEMKIMLSRVSSLQRHDFMNMLQIITGYMQIEEYENALNAALEYGQKTESFGRLQKHGLTITCLLIDHYIKIYSNHEKKIEILNSLSPIEQNMKNEKKAAVELLDEILDRYSKEPIEKIIMNFEYSDKIIIRILLPVCENVELLDLILKYKDVLPDIETGLLENEFFWDYIEFGLFD